MAQCRAAGLVVTGDLGGAVSVDAAAAIAAAVPNTVEGAPGLKGRLWCKLSVPHAGKTLFSLYHACALSAIRRPAASGKTPV